MIKRMTVYRKTQDGMNNEGSRDMAISLPAPPFAFTMATDRPETNPRGPMVKGKMDRQFVREMARVQR